jgi:hypothetical protein
MLQSNQASANMGHGVAGAGDVNGDGYADVIVGAINYDDGETNEGAAFVFLGGPAGIANGNPSTATTKIQANQASADLGRSVAAAGDVNGDGYGDVIVGARFWDSNAMETNEGAAFVFLGSPAGIVASGNPANADAVIQSNQSAAELGRGVSGAGDVNGDGYADVIVGAYLYNAPEADEGAAFVFLGSAAGIADGTPTTAHAQLESDQAGALFGLSVAGAGDINGDGYADVIVGASSYDDVAINAGGAFVFLGGALGIGDGTADTADAKLTSTYASANMGESVASAGDVNGDGFADVIVGASVFDSPENDEGAAFVFLGSNRGIVDGSTGTAAAWLSGFASDIYPLSMAGAGDVNGDGYADVIVGHPSFQDHGAAFVFLGGPAGIAYGSTATAAAELTSSQYGALMGSSVDGAGDVNGDGYDDVIVGAPHYTEGGAYLGGAAFVFLGSPTGIADGSEATAATRVWSGQAAAWMGNVAGVGDVNGDGYGDVMVGAPGYESQASEDDEGAAFIFLGSATGIADGELASAATRIESNQSAAWLGSSLAGAGDVNGDGFADVIVGNALNCSGSAYIFHGSASGVANGTPATAATQLDTDESCARFGQTLDGAGDVNADGYADVIVGASHYFSPTSEEGAAFIFLGGAGGIADGTPATADTRLESDQLEAWFGSSVSGAGDVNADGYADVIVGAYFYDDEPQANDGAAFVFLGGAGGIPNGTAEPSAAAMIQGDFANGYSGIVAGPGDVNGDGYADVMIGTRQPGVGNVSVHLGNGGELGRPTVAQQLRGDGSGTAVSPWGKSDLDGFAVRMHVMHPEGRGRAKLEVEHCQAGVPFGNPSCEAAISPAWIDVGVGVINGTVSLTVPLTDLDASLYRWRARVLHAPYRVTQAGITPPPKPAHGPWRRVGAQSVEADVRIPARICDDGLDNDLDGLVDFPADPGCSSGSDTSEHSASLVCDDGLDNDGDGFTDDPADPGCFSVTSAIENPRCQDGIDNDSDGKFDFDGGASANGGVALGLPDPQCTAPHRNKETPNSCGLGVEIVPALALLRAVRRRVRRSDSRMMGWATK